MARNLRRKTGKLQASRHRGSVCLAPGAGRRDVALVAVSSGAARLEVSSLCRWSPGCLFGPLLRATRPQAGPAEQFSELPESSNLSEPLQLASKSDELQRWSRSALEKLLNAR
ncbi:hypothetical protein PF005_g20312 [Phytophthora fragariae]|uniref:Uncharacterized protein n=1 Tax=Phytophthora fragariae TaxID=53985 RepID=A0A6A3WMR4_9STRA|nr:hypothetical protein PF003_g34529 [Phytophthora fragariae]KAE8929111.1 hypothetical protein PF009_g20769 [Phytophthora fragariae]KAE9081616.1 hypothetical protein PF006_g27078 [Phytophthora fragariae]KAE9088908.1 hypothetical protein PF007_g19799 [Phytophthora fragariae]KAE9187795.1 hypothetical protein PF005_g20312 [Phytophthora fragariae]